MDIVGSLVRIADFSLGREDIIVAIAEREGKARVEGKAEADVRGHGIARVDAPDQHVADHFIHVAREVIEIGDPAIDNRGIRRHQEIDPRLDRPEARTGGDPRRDPEFIITDPYTPTAPTGQTTGREK